MTGDLFTALIYFVAGFASIYLFLDRRKRVASMNRSLLPQLDQEEFDQLKYLFKSATERILYLAIPLIMLGVTNLRNSAREAKLFFLILLVLLFLYNIPPRNKIMHFFEQKGINYKELKKQGIKF